MNSLNPLISSKLLTEGCSKLSNIRKSDSLKFSFRTIYDDSAAIGKRYARQDLIGTPFCIADDFKTKEDNCVTIRHHDSTEQERVPISELKERIGKAASVERILEEI